MLIAMAASSRLMITEAEGRVPLRLRVVIPPTDFGEHLNRMHAWLDDTCGADGWSITPAGMRGVINDAVAVYFRDGTLAAAFVARRCAPATRGMAEGFFRVRDDEPAARVPAPHHKTF
jgi:hypothetical protein